jgi:PAS domain S-box-containing protein
VSNEPPAPPPGDRPAGAEPDGAPGLDEARLLSLEAQLNDIELIIEMDGTIHHANDRAVSAYGYGRDELRSMNMRDLRGRSTVTDTGAQLRRADEGGVRFETVHRRRDGSEFPVEVSSRGFTAGGVRYLHSLVRDLTEARTADARVAESEERLRSIIAAMAEGVILVDQAGRVLATNEAVERILGLSRDEIEGHSPAETGWRAIRGDGTAFAPPGRPRGGHAATGSARRRGGRGWSGGVRAGRVPGWSWGSSTAARPAGSPSAPSRCGVPTRRFRTPP